MAEGVAVKQTVSAPFALITIALCAGLAFLIFSRPQFQAAQNQEVFMLPFAPEVNESEVASVRQALLPLGASAIYPPLPADRMKGARLAFVTNGSPAAIGGLRPGDLVVSFDGREIANPFALAGAASIAEPEKPIEVIVERGGEKQTLIVPGLRRIQTKEDLF